MSGASSDAGDEGARAAHGSRLSQRSRRLSGASSDAGDEGDGEEDDDEDGGTDYAISDSEEDKAAIKIQKLVRGSNVRSNVAEAKKMEEEMQKEKDEETQFNETLSKYPDELKQYKNIPPAYKNRILYSEYNTCQPNFYYSDKINFLSNYPVTCIIKIKDAYLRIININISIDLYFKSIFLSTIHTILEKYSKEDFLILNLQHSKAINIKDKSILENHHYTLASYHSESFTIENDEAKIHLSNMFFIRKDIVKVNNHIQKFEDYSVLNNGNFVALKSKLFLNGEIFYFVNVSFEKMAFKKEMTANHYYDFYKNNIEYLYNSLKLGDSEDTMGQVKDLSELPFNRTSSSSGGSPPPTEGAMTSDEGDDSITPNHPNFFIAGNFESMSNAILTSGQKQDSGGKMKTFIVNYGLLNKKSILTNKEANNINYIGKMYRYPEDNLIPMKVPSHLPLDIDYVRNQNNDILNTYFQENYYQKQDEHYNIMFNSKAPPKILDCQERRERSTGDTSVQMPVAGPFKPTERDILRERSQSSIMRGTDLAYLSNDQNFKPEEVGKPERGAERVGAREGHAAAAVLRATRIGGQNLKKSNNKRMSKKKNHNLRNNSFSNKTKKKNNKII